MWLWVLFLVANCLQGAADSDVYGWPEAYISEQNRDTSGSTVWEWMFAGLRNMESALKLYHTYTDWAMTAAEAACHLFCFCTLHCSSQLSCSKVLHWLSCSLELCADMPLRINQAYQSDRCLSTCYKHLPHLTSAPSPHRLFTSVQPPYLWLCLLSGSGSNTRSCPDLLF